MVMERLCRCFAPPEGTLFEKEGLYQWSYIRDGYLVYHESGASWSAGELEFYCHFQILSGKPF